MRVACIEIWGSLWMSLTETFGVSRINKTNDSLMSTQAMISTSMQELQSREQVLQGKIKDCTISARECMAKVPIDRCTARSHIMRGKRCSSQLKTVENMILSLEAQQDAIDNTVLSSTVFTTFKGASEAFTSWQKQSASVIDVDEVDSIKQGFEDSIRNANDISYSMALPMPPIMDDEHSLTEELDDILEGLETRLSLAPSLEMESTQLESVRPESTRVLDNKREIEHYDVSAMMA